jgi:hypothetical protein
MGPSRPSRLMAHDRAWRNLASRPISPQNVKAKAWPGAKPAFTAVAEPPPAETKAASVPGPARERANLPAAIMVMVGVTFGAVLGLVGWPVLQSFGVVKEPVIETVQREQGELIARLDATIQALNSTVADLSAQVATTSDKQEAASQFMAEIDARFLALRKSMRDLREAQNAAEQSWLQPVTELTAASQKARNDIVQLRASLDELKRLRHPQAAAIGTRMDQIEQAMVQDKLPGAIRGSISAQEARPRSPVVAERSSAADGFIFDLKPAR